MMGSMVEFSQQSYDSIVNSQYIPNPNDCVIESSDESESVAPSTNSYCPPIQPTDGVETVIAESETQSEVTHHRQSLAQTVRHSFSDGSMERPNSSSQKIPESSDDETIPESQSQNSTIYSIDEYVSQSQDDVISNSLVENVPLTSSNEEIISETPSESSSDGIPNHSAVVQHSDSYFVDENESGDDAVNNENASVNDDVRTIFSIQPNPFRLSEGTKAILEQIENIMLNAITNLANGNKLKITVQNRSTWSNCTFEDEKFSLRPISSAKCRNVQSTFSLSLIFFILKEIYGMLRTNQKCTMRELYYKDVTITQKQENVAEALKIICCLLDKTPWQLGVMSSSKGIISGPLQIHLPEYLIVDCGIHKTGMTLPHFTVDIQALITTAKYVLVVEKDTVFKKLVQCNIMDRWNHKCILITGRGYPDMNTRLILKKIYEMHSLPIYVITDGDPYGIEIMLTYRHGSLSMSNLSNELAVPSIRWLGIFPSDIKKFGIKSVPLTQEDKRKLNSILNRPYINDHVHRELLIMKQINLKAEIEGISDSSCSYLIDVYLRNKIDTNNAI